MPYSYIALAWLQEAASSFKFDGVIHISDLITFFTAVGLVIISAHKFDIRLTVIENAFKTHIKDYAEVKRDLKTHLLHNKVDY